MQSAVRVMQLKIRFIVTFKKSCIAVWACHPTSRGSRREKGAVMKTLLTTLAFSVALATPSLSQAPDRTEQLAQYQPRTYNNRDYNAYARDRDVRVNPRAGRSINRRNDVYDQRGDYVGSDP